MKFKAYHKIGQYKDVVRTIRLQANFKGLDSEKNPIYEESEKPVVKFKGTVKLHGTNAGVSYHPNEGILALKRSSFLDKDDLASHFGFNQFVQVSEKEYLTSMLNKLWLRHCSKEEQIILYGEWAGDGIQKGVGISSLPKSFYIFDCKVYDTKLDESRWIDISNLRFHNPKNDTPEIKNKRMRYPSSIFNIHQFDTYEIDIDFNNPAASQKTLVNITEKVEAKCPVAGSGVGEGIVWTGFWRGEKYIFKVKGEKHSTTKVKTLASVDPEVLNSIHQFVDSVATQNRIEQGILETDAKEKKDIPALLKWVANDIITEEDDTLKANGLEWKQVAREVSDRVRRVFFSKIEAV